MRVDPWYTMDMLGSWVDLYETGGMLEQVIAFLILLILVIGSPLWILHGIVVTMFGWDK